MGEAIEFPRNGEMAQGYLATPSGGTGPGVVVIQEWWGLNDNIREIADRYAAEGFVALAPDLYDGQVTTEPDEALSLAMSLQLEKTAKSMSGAVDEVQRRSGRDEVGVTGFCMGGGLALFLATTRPDAVVAAAPFYGLVPPQAGPPDWAGMRAAVQGHYAENDDRFPPSLATTMGDELKALGKEVEILVYPGTEHAFFNDTRPEVFDADAAALSWQRTLDFFRSKLGS